MRRELEALLFATDQPLTLAKLASLFPDMDRKDLRQAVNELREEYDRDERGFTVVEFGGGYSITTRPEHAKLVRQLYRGRRKARLSKAALECLAIIAYKQPVTRLEIEEIRGVSVAGVVGTLMERDLISIVGRAESLGHPLLYGSTKAFLDYLGLQSIKELPQLSELEDILAQREELKQLVATSKFGDRLSEDDLEAALAPPEEEAEAEEDVADDGDEAETSEDEPEASNNGDGAESSAPVAEPVGSEPDDADDSPEDEAPAARAAATGGAD